MVKRKFGDKWFNFFGTYQYKRNAKREQKSKSSGFYTRITNDKGMYQLWIRNKPKSKIKIGKKYRT